MAQIPHAKFSFRHDGQSWTWKQQHITYLVLRRTSKEASRAGGSSGWNGGEGHPLPCHDPHKKDTKRVWVKEEELLLATVLLHRLHHTLKTMTFNLFVILDLFHIPFHHWISSRRLLKPIKKEMYPDSQGQSGETNGHESKHHSPFPAISESWALVNEGHVASRIRLPVFLFTAPLNKIITWRPSYIYRGTPASLPMLVKIKKNVTH